MLHSCHSAHCSLSICQPVCLSVCMPISGPLFLIRWKKINSTKVLLLIAFLQIGRAGDVYCIFRLLLGSTAASHSLDRSPGKGRVGEGGGSLVPGVQSCCTGEESEAPNSAHAQTGRIQTTVQTSVSQSR